MNEPQWNQEPGEVTVDTNGIQWLNAGVVSLESLRAMAKQLMSVRPHPIEAARAKRLRKNRKRVWDARLGGWTGHGKFADRPRADYEKEK